MPVSVSPLLRWNTHQRACHFGVRVDLMLIPSVSAITYLPGVFRSLYLFCNTGLNVLPWNACVSSSHSKLSDYAGMFLSLLLSSLVFLNFDFTFWGDLSIMLLVSPRGLDPFLINTACHAVWSYRLQIRRKNKTVTVYRIECSGVFFLWSCLDLILVFWAIAQITRFVDHKSSYS